MKNNIDDLKYALSRAKEEKTYISNEDIVSAIKEVFEEEDIKEIKEKL